ncbi:MAG TPA: DUF1415 family protein [Polyangiaceae bacterium]|jgi:hypothetical protein
MDHLNEQWVREAERLHGRYLTEVVEAFGLCPWAERARRAGRTRVAVLLDCAPPVAGPVIEQIDRWASDERVDIGFIVFPRLPLGRIEFDRFVALLQRIDAERHALGNTPFAFAGFHPDGQLDLGDAERLIPFLRRTPDPSVQLVRMSALKRVRAGTPEGTQFVDVASLDAPPPSDGSALPLRQRIAQANLETVRRGRLEELRTRLEAIQRDRAASYGPLEAQDASSGFPS